MENQKSVKIGRNSKHCMDRLPHPKSKQHFKLCEYPEPLKIVQQVLNKQRARSNAPQADKQFIADKAESQFRKQGKA